MPMTTTMSFLVPPARNSKWAPVVWNAVTRQQAYATTASSYTISLPGGPTDLNSLTIVPAGGGSVGGNGTISSCFYLLVKYAEVTPSQFLCPQDPNTSEFMLAQEDANSGIAELTQAWDFGSKPQTHCSYTYQAPWSSYALTTSEEPGKAVVADRNPYLASPGNTVPKTFIDPNNPAIFFAGKAGDEACQKYGNSTVHGGQGQNVLFLDTHVTFETRAYCGLQDDNIYTISTFPDQADEVGAMPVYSPTFGTSGTIKSRRDSVLLHDPPTWPTGTGQK